MKVPPIVPNQRRPDASSVNPSRSPTLISGQSARPILEERRLFLKQAVSGTTVVALCGGVYALSDLLTNEAHAATRIDGRPRLPPGQRVLEQLRPMGGEPGSTKLSEFRLRVHGAVQHPFELGFRELLELGSVERSVDVHCVTGWSVLGARFRGVPLAELAKKASLKSTAQHIIFEAAHGYTANVRLDEALGPNCLVTWELNGARLPLAHGAPVRALMPDLYFWKSPKWLTGIRFVEKDEPGYWETRGYNNHADPWREERYA
jgi:DMSO/TMAO reductase YedYZ molybdopterin-dependent catalytic subunit